MIALDALDIWTRLISANLRSIRDRDRVKLLGPPTEWNCNFALDRGQSRFLPSRRNRYARKAEAYHKDKGAEFSFAESQLLDGRE